MESTSKLSLAYAAAARAEADYRTALKVIEGRPVRGRVADRIRRALAELGANG